MNPATDSEKIQRCLARLAEYLRSYRMRAAKSQHEMSTILGLSLPRYRDYENNTTDSTKGISLDMLYRFSQLESLDLPRFIALLEGTSHSALDDWEQRILSLFSRMGKETREEFLSGVERRDTESRLVRDTFNWVMDVSLLLISFGEQQRILFERQLIDYALAYSLKKDTEPEKYHRAISRLQLIVDEMYKEARQ